MSDIDTLSKQNPEIVPDHSILDCMNPLPNVEQNGCQSKIAVGNEKAVSSNLPIHQPEHKKEKYQVQKIPKQSAVGLGCSVLDQI